MRIHTDTLSISDIYRAARFARADVVKANHHGSRSRDHAFDVNLEGESRRRPNSGASGATYASGYAATWDQWGVFLSILFDLDPNMVTPYYADRDEFNTRTAGRFQPDAVAGMGHSSNANVINVTNYRGEPIHRIADAYWPADAHGDHTFRAAGGYVQKCTWCSATQRWS